MKNMNWKYTLVVAIIALAAATNLSHPVNTTVPNSINIKSCDLEYVRVTEVPRGEAPLEIRKAWVGVVLPTLGGNKPKLLEEYGALTRNPYGTISGYSIDGRTAIEMLAKYDSNAANWWRENAPHTTQPGYYFIFPVESCTPVASRVRGTTSQCMPELL
jgi:hypothetical protein